METEIFTPEMLEVIKTMPCLKSEDIAAAVVYVLGTPPHVQVKILERSNEKFFLIFFLCLQVHELTIKPVGEKF